MIHRLIPLLLLVVFLYQGLGYYLVYHARQYGIRDQIRKRIESNDFGNKDLHLLQISVKSGQSALIWLKADEFIFQDGLYDVAERKQAGDTLYLYCYKDAEEETLIAHLKAMVKAQSDRTDKGKQGKFRPEMKWPQKDHFYQEDSLCFSEVYTMASPDSFHHCLSYRNVFSETSVPPPKMLFL